MYEEDKDSVILRLRVELAQERAKRKELALVERDWSRERARTEHALERALVDERVHGLELEASRVKLERELVRLREEKESWEREKVKERRRNMIYVRQPSASRDHGRTRRSMIMQFTCQAGASELCAYFNTTSAQDHGMVLRRRPLTRV